MGDGERDDGAPPDETAPETDVQRHHFGVGERRRHRPHLDASPDATRAERRPKHTPLWKSEVMADDGTEPSSDDLWADTRPDRSATPEGSQPSGPPPGPPSPPPTVGPDPTLVQPVLRGPVLPPGVPPTGGPPGGPPDPPGGAGDRPEGPPPWLLPAAAALIGLLVVGLVVALVVRDGTEEDSAVTTLPLIGTVEPSTTMASGTTAPTSPPSSAPATPAPTAATTTAATTTTAAPTTAAPTTAAPTTAAPTTAAPTTAAPTTAAPPPTRPDPGFAVVDGTTVEIAASCLVLPLEPNTADLQIVSHLLVTDDGRLVLDRWFDEGGVDGLDGEFVDSGSVLETTALDAVGPAFTATLRPVDGGDAVDVAVNPDPDRSLDCPDTIRTRDADDAESSQYTHAILDVCTVRPGDDDRLDVAGIGSEGARFAVDDNGDGTVELRFTDRRVGDLVDPDAEASFDETVATYDGLAAGDGDELRVRIEVELAAPRTCEPSEAP